MLQPYNTLPITIGPSKGWRLVVTSVNSGSTLKLGHLRVRDESEEILPNTFSMSSSTILSGVLVSQLFDVSLSTFVEFSLPATISLYRGVGQTIDIRDITIAAAALDGIPVNLTLEQSGDTTDGINGIWNTVLTRDASVLPLLMNSALDVGVINVDEKMRGMRYVTTNSGLTKIGTGAMVGNLGRDTGQYVFEFFVFSSGSGGGGITSKPSEQIISTGDVGQVVGVNGQSVFKDSSVNVGSKTSFFTQEECMVVVDLDTKKMELIQNNISLGVVEPYTTTGKMFPLAIFFFNNALNVVNYGATPFVNDIPPSYTSWDDNQSNFVSVLDSTTAQSILTNNNLTSASVGSVFNGAESTVFRSNVAGGKYYAEVTLDSIVNNVLQFTGVAIGAGNILTGTQPGFGGNNVGFNSNLGRVISGGALLSGTSTIGAFTSGTIQILYDADNDKIEFGYNDTFTGQGTMPIGQVKIAVVNFDSTATINFGATPFTYNIPIGCTSWDGSQQG
jgi:hypothetical protein